MRSSVRRALLLGCALALAACDGGTEVRDAAVAGRWLYRGSVGGCEVTGVLRLTQQGSTVGGTLAWPGGECGSSALPVDSTATLTGRVDGDRAVFTLRGWGSTITHQASVRADSMVGTVAGAPWARGAAGSFGARRYAADQLPPERFHAAAEGAVADTVEGRAHADRWEIVMLRDDGGARITFAEDQRDRGFPDEPGTYRVRDWTMHPDSLAGGLVYFGDASRAFRMRDGTVTIASASGGYVRGTFDVAGYRPGAPAVTVRLRGSFNARRQSERQLNRSPLP